MREWAPIPCSRLTNATRALENATITLVIVTVVLVLATSIDILTQLGWLRRREHHSLADERTEAARLMSRIEVYTSISTP